MSTPQNPVLMAIIGAAHGIKGELRVKSFTGDPLALDAYGPLFAADGRRFDVLSIRPQKEVVVVRFKGVADRDAAEALTGVELFVDRSALPEDLEEEEFYHADLIGLDVRDETGAPVGTIAAVQNFGGGDMLEVAVAGRGTVLIPFTRAAAPSVDIAGRVVTIDSLAAGMRDEGDAEQAEAERQAALSGEGDAPSRARKPRPGGRGR